MRELVLTRKEGTIEAYLLEHRQLVEYHEQSEAPIYTLGDIFLGEVVQIVSGLNAAFIEIGLSREGFLHYTDIGPELFAQKDFLSFLKQGLMPPPELPKPSNHPLPREGKISDFLKVGDWVLVQVVKEMAESKGPRLTTSLALAGQTLLLMPFSADIGISHRISDAHLRQRWREYLHQLYLPPYGLILRTNGADATSEEVAAEYHRLIQRWEYLLSRLQDQSPPYRLTEDSLHMFLSELLSPPPHTIHITDEGIYHRLQEYLRDHPLPHSPSLRLHRRPEKLRNLFDLHQAKKSLLGRTVTLPNGAYLVIEHTEALHVIDVNTGSLPAKGASVEEIIFQTNLLAAAEVARQIRLRDLGGIIVVDFIDMRNPLHRQLVQERLREAMRSDRAKHSILPMTEIGLVQITRQRRRQPIELPEGSVCSFCHGSGKVASPADSLQKIQRIIQFWSEKYIRLPLKVRVHPLWANHWFMSYPHYKGWVWGLIPHRWLCIETDATLSLSTVEIFAPSGKIIIASE
ncbi:MAG: Rne/Rng family ribonuclease [Bacteroidia bacterium]|nr:Rne/Rng family ribonuclease [Bacteroidia bacterium]MDW8015605.1 Rne/Rng family ribonuclease [Bacteroidia bacterium]